MQRYAEAEQQLRKKPGRGIITFLIVANVESWIIDTLLEKKLSEWNEMTEDKKSSNSRNALKSKLKPKKSQTPYYEHELTRISSVKLARIRVGNYHLNSCLHDRLMNETVACDCGHPIEDPSHYFLMCERYDRQRKDVVLRIPLEARTIKTILHGSSRYDDKLNKEICLTAQTYITASGRF